MKSATSIGTILLLVLFAYSFILLLLYLFQAKLVYFPDKNIYVTPREIGLSFKDYYFKTADGYQLHGWHIPVENARGTVLFFHGNAGNISHRLESIQVFIELGFAVFIFDYRGFGLSHGKPDEEGTYRDADAAWDFLVRELKEHPNRIVIFGRSLGSAVAAYLSSRVEPGVVILESSFTSTPDLGAHIYPFIPVRFLARINYPTNEFVAKISRPVLFIHSRQDEIIPFHHGEINFQSARDPKSFLEIHGSHNDGFIVSRATYINGISQFLSTYYHPPTRI